MLARIVQRGAQPQLVRIDLHSAVDVESICGLMTACMQSAEALWLRGPWLQQPQLQHAADALARVLASCAPHLRHLRVPCSASVPCAQSVPQALLAALGARLVTLDLLLPWPCTVPPALRGCAGLRHLKLRFEEPDDGCTAQPAAAGAGDPGAVAVIASLAQLRSLALAGTTWMPQMGLSDPSDLTPLRALAALTRLHADTPTVADLIRGRLCLSPVDEEWLLGPMLAGGLRAALRELVLPGTRLAAENTAHLAGLGALTRLAVDGLCTSGQGARPRVVQPEAGRSEEERLEAERRQGAPPVPLPPRLAVLEVQQLPSAHLLACFARHPLRPRLRVTNLGAANCVRYGVPGYPGGEQQTISMYLNLVGVDQMSRQREGGKWSLQLPGWVGDVLGAACEVLERDVFAPLRELQRRELQQDQRRQREEQQRGEGQELQRRWEQLQGEGTGAGEGVSGGGAGEGVSGGGAGEPRQAPGAGGPDGPAAGRLLRPDGRVLWEGCRAAEPGEGVAAGGGAERQPAAAGASDGGGAAAAPAAGGADGTRSSSPFARVPGVLPEVELSVRPGDGWGGSMAGGPHGPWMRQLRPLNGLLDAVELDGMVFGVSDLRELRAALPDLQAVRSGGCVYNVAGLAELHQEWPVLGDLLDSDGEGDEQEDEEEEEEEQAGGGAAGGAEAGGGGQG